MCGICGVYGLERIDQPSGVVRKMSESLSHRGPDAAGEYVGSTVALGHRRLSIIDLSEDANQPMKSADGRLVVVFNGELYNYRQLKKELSAYPFKTNSDTEVVVAALHTWGINAVQRFDGMFSIAVWDEQSKELYLVRDRLGVKPLYYAETGQSVVFASEIRALMASGLVERKTNRDSIVDFLRYQTVHAPRTIIDGVQMLMPGTYMHISDTEQKTYSYWSLTRNAKTVYGEIADVQKQVNTLLESAVQKRLVSDVPFGAFLSGGIDSSIIVGLMAQNQSAPVKTFSVIFDEDEFSEAPYARMIAEKFATDHQEIRLTPADFLNDLPQALAAMDHPSGDGPNTFVVSQVTKNAGISMAHSGTGGDELFAGYDIFKRINAIQDKRWLLSFPKWMRGAVGSALYRMKPSIAAQKKTAVLEAGYFDLEYIYWVNRLLFFDRRIKQVLNLKDLPANSAFLTVQDHVEYGTEGFGLPLLSQVSVAEITTYLQNVLLRDADQMSMAHALEVRVPFMDHQLVEYVLGIQDAMKYPHTPKKLLVDSFPGLLPNEIVDRPKMGFTFPWRKWLKEDLRNFVGDHISDLSKRELFNKAGVERLWNDFDRNAPDVNYAHVWNLVVLENWVQQNDVDV